MVKRLVRDQEDASSNLDTPTEEVKRIGKRKKRIAIPAAAKHADRVITLCGRCKDDYRTAGFKVVPDYTNSIKSPCEICGRAGTDYFLITRQG